MAPAPAQVPFTSVAGSQWQQTFTITDSNGHAVDLTGLTWEFVIRPNVVDATEPALVQVTTTATAQGQITVTPLAGTVTVALTPAATAVLVSGSRSHALWSNPGTTTATAWVSGTFHAQLVATP